MNVVQSLLIFLLMTTVTIHTPPVRAQIAASDNTAEIAKATNTAEPTSSALPHCIDDKATIDAIQSSVQANRKTSFKYKGYREALHSDSDVELLARLAYSETLAANCPTLTGTIAPGIVNTIYNRVRIKNGNVKAVVFQRDQFASSLNVYSESRYRDFLCPKNLSLWNQVLTEATRSLAGRSSQLSKDTVNYFLFKHSAKWTKPPWTFDEDQSQSTPESQKCIRFFHVPGWK